MIPAIQKGDPQWSELRAMGIGWWVRNINTLRRCIEKVFLLLTNIVMCCYALTDTSDDLCRTDPFVLQPSYYFNSCLFFSISSTETLVLLDNVGSSDLPHLS